MLQGKVPRDVVSKRQQYVNCMKKFVEEQKGKLQDALDKLGLDLSNLSEVEPKQMCPYDNNHIIPEKFFKKHTEVCKLKSAGCQKDELELQLQDLDFAYKDASSVMKVEIDERTLNKVLWDSCVQNGQVYTGHRHMPKNHIEENIELTKEDRLALHQYVVKKSHEAGKVLPIDRNDDLLTTDWGSLVKKGLLDEQNNKEYGSKLEQLAALRDMKRRRQSYRAKNVHITKKSYTEIIREVIVNQMEILVPDTLQESTKGDKMLQSAATESQLDDFTASSGSRQSKHGKDWRSSRDDRDQSRRKHSRRSGSRDRRSRDSNSRGNPYSFNQPRQGDYIDDYSPPSAIKAETDERRHSKYDEFPHASKMDQHFENKGSFGLSRKRSLSSSSNESSDEKAKKSKKSKHKKKHSKKHKRKN